MDLGKVSRQNEVLVFVCKIQPHLIYFGGIYKRKATSNNVSFLVRLKVHPSAQGARRRAAHHRHAARYVCDLGELPTSLEFLFLHL